MAGALSKWDPFADFGEFRSGFDRMFGEWLGGRGRAHTPEIDVVRENGQLVVRADMPGFKSDEVKIQAQDGLLTISGEHQDSAEHKDSDYVRRERRYGSFYRAIALPAGVAADQIKATNQDGVLEVTVPLPSNGSEHEPVTITPTAA